MAVLNPVKVIIDNYLEKYCEEMESVNNPEDESKGKRKFLFRKPFSLNGTILWKIPK